MEQRFRRQLLALGKLIADERQLRERFAESIEEIRSAPIERWPYPDDVRDLLMASGLAPAVVDALTVQFEREVWGGGRPGG